MKIGLVDIDGHAKKKKWGATIYPNLALCKIARWHKQQGDDVEWAFPFEHYDVVYMSKVFNFSPDDTTVYQADKIVKGGTGYDIASRLPDEIDSLSVPDEIKDILKMSDEERKEKSRREAQEWMDSILKCRISSALAKRQLYKSLYHLSDEDVENAMQNYFCRSGITNEDMIRLGFEATLH